MKFKVLNLYVVVCSVLLFNQAMAQNETADSLASIYDNYYKLMEKSATVDKKIDDLSKNFSGVDRKLKNLNDNLTTSLEQVNRLTTEDILSKKARLQTQKEKIIKTAVFVGHANNSFDAIDAALAQSDYLNDVTILNNPTNTDLGFSLTDDIVAMLNKKIIKGNRRFNNKNVGKFMAFVKNTIKDPVVTSVANSVPALSAITSVVNLVSSVIIKEKGVTVKDFQEFKKELDRYTRHYNGLSRANQGFNANVENLKLKIEALRTVLNNYTMDRVTTLHPNLMVDKNTALHTILATYYAPIDLERNVDKILEGYTQNGQIDFEPALNDERLAYPFYAINQAQFINQELESLTNEYVSSYRSYHKAISQVLNNSKSLSKEPHKIDKKLELLDGKLERLVKTFEKNVKIELVGTSLNGIPTL